MKHKKYTDEYILRELDNIKARFELEDETPTNEQVNEYCSDAYDDRTGRIVSRKIKWYITQTVMSETSFGRYGEMLAQKILTEKGYNVQLMPLCNPAYDLLIDNAVCIDVKTARHTDSGHSKRYSFNIGTENPVTDIYMFICVPEEVDGEIDIYVIPAQAVRGNISVSIGNGGKYEKYKNNYSIISRYRDFFNGMVI